MPFVEQGAYSLLRQVEARLPTKWGNFKMVAFSNGDNDLMPHLAIVHEGFDPSQTVYLRIHSECITGDLFGSTRCDCGDQLEAALQKVAEKAGVILYLRQEGRGIGLVNKLKAYNLQDSGLNTAEANSHLGLEVDARQYDIAIAMMMNFGIKSIHLITNNPSKIEAIENSTIEVVSRVPLVTVSNSENRDYLRTKELLMGHLFDYSKSGK